ncbi:MAG TPA: hypothetical protein VHM91_00275, partial [Verrucomicrobiales bacterium]|nr:hypothetical protein [Verrucomicrobiales bacterium]
MKLPSVLFFVIAAALGGYFAGRWQENNAARPAKSSGSLTTSASPGSAKQQKTADSIADLLLEAPPGQPNTRLLSALRVSLEDNSEFRRKARWGYFLDAMRPEDAPAVRGILREMERQGRTFVDERDAFWARWGELDGKAAIAAVNA